MNRREFLGTSAAGMSLLAVPPAAVKVESIPAGATFELVVWFGRVTRYIARKDGLVWWGDADVDLMRGFVVKAVNGPQTEAAFWMFFKTASIG